MTVMAGVPSRVFMSRLSLLFSCIAQPGGGHIENMWSIPEDV
jgi:hypothetical protein